jgi:hypothetical protein
MSPLAPESSDGKCAAKLFMTRLHVTAFLQVTGSYGIEVLTGLIIRRSWVRSPPAPLVQVRLWPVT